MEPSKWKIALHMVVCIVTSFIFIYVLGFIGGWKLISSKDPILIELAIVGIIIELIFESSRYFQAKINMAEKKIEELEKQVKELSDK